ncbi:DUF2778 domain-containing protein [Cupriavidus sp. 2KB_3]|uniref:DUF2778 domain-containing protein n=1 Tax=Cupriavidus TaxID=106589 RepID=UPI0011EFCF61|nr:DUF2778 domain-containing protein [Cupriavidus campinensis]
MIDLTFYLNDRPMSRLRAGVLDVPAFSGRDGDINSYLAACRKNSGPITPGTYYVLDRPSGGRLRWFREQNPFSTDRRRWFALFAADGRVDDVSRFCAEVERGEFRLHPNGSQGISEGCIAVNCHTDFDRLRALLKASTVCRIPNTDIACYGRLTVKRSTP